LTHVIKISPQYFDDVANKIKPFEVRYNDRNYKVGDSLHLREFDGEKYTPRSIFANISYVLDDEKYCKAGYVIMALSKVRVYDPRKERGCNTCKHRNHCTFETQCFGANMENYEPEEDE